MKITLVFTGKTDEPYIREGIEVYAGRLRHYLPFDIVIAGNNNKKKKTGRAASAHKEPLRNPGASLLILLDEKGDRFTSQEFARFLETSMIGGHKELAFYTGGPYGFTEEMYKKADRIISLSDMTFTHQMVRLILVEQIYRAMTIIRGEAYHH